MIFNELGFIFLFLPLCFFVFSISKKAVRKYILIAFSFMFYGFAGVEHLFVLIASVIWVSVCIDFGGGEVQPSRLRVFMATLFPISALVFFKYTNFILSHFSFIEFAAISNDFNLFSNVILPAGISFFTFQLIGYCVDRRTKLIRKVNFSDLMLFISFFPQLVAGPIARFSELSKPIENLTNFSLSWQKFNEFLIYFTFGLFLKVVCADTLGHSLEQFKQSPSDLGFYGLGFLTFGYSFQIYFDFFGYSLCAIGLGKLFGFELTVNFINPYSALNPKDFWRRWHVSLSRFIRDYLYIPLGGNQKYARNLFLVFLICGLWHGAGHSFLIWGFFHFLLVSGYSVFSVQWDKQHRLVQTTVNFCLVSIGWLFFVFPINDLLIAFSSLKLSDGGMLPTLENILLLVVFGAFAFKFKIEEVCLLINSQNESLRLISGVGIGLVFFICLLFMSESGTFIYFRF